MFVSTDYVRTSAKIRLLNHETCVRYQADPLWKMFKSFNYIWENDREFISNHKVFN